MGAKQSHLQFVRVRRFRESCQEQLPQQSQVSGDRAAGFHFRFAEDADVERCRVLDDARTVEAEPADEFRGAEESRLAQFQSTHGRAAIDAEAARPSVQLLRQERAIEARQALTQAEPPARHVADAALWVIRRRGDEIDVIGQQRQHVLEFERVIRAIAVHRTHDVRVGRGNAGEDRFRDAAIGLVPHEAAVVTSREDGVQHVPSRVRAAIIHEQERRPISRREREFELFERA